MKNATLKNVLKLVTAAVLVASIFFSISIFGAAANVEKVTFTDATVNSNSLNMRQGPSTSMPVVAVLKKNQAVKVLGKQGDWYFIFDSASGKVGAVHGSYLAPVNANTKNDPKLPAEQAPTKQNPSNSSAGASANEKEVLDLVNNARKNAGAGTLEFDNNLAKVARDKAKDMVTNNYFSHQSPTYGSPFEMMRKYGVTFKAAGENIAGNQTMEGAFRAWMNSEGHKKNILNGNFNATGIGVYTSPVYGKIIVQQFIRK
jgi:uncharacterized YkwD family protein